MNKIIWDIEIKICLPSNVLIIYPNEEENFFIENPNFKNLRKKLNIEIDIVSWYGRYLDMISGKKELQVIDLYYSSDKESYILIDNYNDLDDQLDLIQLGVKTTAELGNSIRKLTRMLNDDSEYNIHYSEGTSCVFSTYPIDEKTKKRYREPQNSKYLKGKVVKIHK